ncbi:flagellar export chaperone FliS [Bacillus sp. FJAT-49711]|uniref:flagellar export chaperone FliS n=1 Tax=Bacillus sp. FJAT-49711 TaxID=2833585 RepID=UPI001BC96650|nr:flagellar export chaperone FliS [Bacillus sp. FJAT-49711]MBS4219353.1 flagellar export chaperone FliS [Bacillus sp. FJAT-49711]
MASANPYQAYRTNAVTTASPGELTLMLYNGCLKFMNMARKAIDSNDIEGKNTNIQKAQNIITELMVTLNMDMDISKNMMALYDYANRRLIEANIHNDLDMIQEVEELITEFRDTWKQAIQMNRQMQHAVGGSGV